MKKILVTLWVSFFSVATSQTLNFTDLKFKALILSSNGSNNIATNSNGNSIAIDTNGDGEIQISEAQQVKILTLKQDALQKYIDPNGNTFDTDNINAVYYNNHLPEEISDALLFSNLQELYFWDVKSATISFINNNKIKKVQGRPIYYDFTQAGQQVAAPINLSFDHCSEIQNITDVIAYPATMNPWSAPENSLTLKNCANIKGDVLISQTELMELYIKNCNINTLTFNSCQLLEKISVPNLPTLTKIYVTGPQNYTHQNIELIAENCISLQEIIADTDHYNETGAYFTTVNLNGCTHLKKIKGLNGPVIDFSTAGLINLEELDCSYYNRYIYNTTSGVYFGNVTSLSLAGLPKLKILKAFNQPITNSVNFSAANALENIDITSSCGYMNTVNVSNLANLHTLKTDRFYTLNTQGNDDLQKITAKNCPALKDFVFKNNNALKELDIENCPSIETLRIDNNFSSLNTLIINQCSGLKELTVENTKITSIDASQCPALQSLELSSNNVLQQINLTGTPLQNISLNALPLLEEVTLSNNSSLKSFQANACPLITHLDFSSCTHFEFLTLESMSNLTYVNMKNSSLEESNFYNYNSNLAICADIDELTNLQNQYPDILFTANCDSLFNTNNSKLNDNKIDIFPNPAKDIIQIRSSYRIKNIQLFDAKGTVLLSKDFNESIIKIDLSSYLQGIYIVNIKTDKEEQLRRIVKK